ncbi:MAG: HEPN domain-containing protein [Elusimicrobia bacterium]|nr:HEPN domain-containing protein [Elusimicrobiota bacterium]
MSGALIKEWLKKAEEDHQSALILARGTKKAVYDVVCFLSQQCAEKYLKAFLAANGADFPKTHSLLELLKLGQRLDPV